MSKVFNKAKIQENLKLEVAISDEMSRAIETWTTMYEGKPYTNNGDVFKRMDLASSISSELARLVTVSNTHHRAHE
ncbi:MAG: hypothetical protein K2G70_03160, partial [Turicibacter sp.]|nr:hypothetical protein [Turicibacter sp.]